ncbi:MAG: hypothetical protein LQ340_005551 [Diploschistes diacapsis]|nr:MAG: hypothetical protein LQ340_005551 [Diploschistes diacapsis]
MRRGKRIRLEKAVQRAEAVLDQTVQKVERSKKRGRTSKDRSVAWDDVNGKLSTKQPAKSRASETPEDDEWEAEEDDTMSEKEVLEGVSGLKVEDATDPGSSNINPPEVQDEETL